MVTDRNLHLIMFSFSSSDCKQRQRGGIFGPRRIAHLSSVNPILTRWNQGVVLHTNVRVSRNLYRSTLSALIAWPGPGRGPPRCDWIGFERSPSEPRPRAISPPPFSSTSAPPSFKDPICPVTSASPTASVNQRWPENRRPGLEMT